ncbi:MAG: hypothetical protein CMQ40_05070 [Gammaproteobacteria bacterium]|nr:hypothetical protein [Gammaproteobacteria bacterium]
MSIKQLANGKYEVRVVSPRINGNRKEARRIASSHAEAERIARQLQLSKSGDEPFDGENQNNCTIKNALDLAYDMFWSHCKDGERLKRKGEFAVEFFGSFTPLNAIRATDITRYQQSMREEGLKDSSINRRMSAVARMWKAASVADRVSMADKPEWVHLKEPEGRLRWLFPDEERKLLGYFEDNGRDDLVDHTRFALDTGLRFGEQEVARPEHVAAGDLTVACLFDEHDQDGDNNKSFFTKNAKSRVIPLTKRCVELVQRRSNQPTLFEGLRYDHVYYWWKKARRDVFDGDKSITPYVTRHTTASRLVQRGLELAKIKKWLGHSSIKVTERYAKMSSRDIRDGVNMLESFVVED